MTKFQIYITKDHLVWVEGDKITFEPDGGLKVRAGDQLVAAFATYLYVLTGE